MIKRINRRNYREGLTRRRNYRESIDLSTLEGNIYKEFKEIVDFPSIFDKIFVGDFEAVSEYLSPSDEDEFWEDYWIDIIEDTCEAFTKGIINALKGMGKI